MSLANHYYELSRKTLQALLNSTWQFNPAGAGCFQVFVGGVDYTDDVFTVLTQADRYFVYTATGTIQVTISQSDQAHQVAHLMARLADALGFPIKVLADIEADDPVNTVAPAVTGTLTIGSTLTTTNGTWTGNATITFARQWLRNGVAIAAATALTYVLADADADATITCLVTASNAFGSATKVSNAVVNTAAIPVNTVAPAITGLGHTGNVETCSTGTWTSQGTTTYAFQWKRDGVNIAAATASTYTLVSADETHAITCLVTATNPVGSASLLSNSVTALA